MTHRRVFITEDPYQSRNADNPWERGKWPCRWVAHPDLEKPPFVTAYRKQFTVETASVVRVHVTADERYELFLDGERIGRGSERGNADNWYSETYDLDLSPGEHIIVARVWTLGEGAPFAQMSVYPGFLLSPDTDEWIAELGTGVAEWDVKALAGYSFLDPNPAWGTGQNLRIDGAAYDWGFERGEGESWVPVVSREAGANPKQRNDFPPLHLLHPATLPSMMEAANPIGNARFVAEIASTETHALPILAADNLPDEQTAWNGLLTGAGTVTIPPQTRRRILIDLENYLCAYPEVTVTGGQESLVRVHWQEALFEEANAQNKGNRDAIEGKYFVTLWHGTDGIGDTFLPDGGLFRTFEPLWWQCGRYVEVVIETQAEALILNSLQFRETRYPLEMESAFEAADPRLTDVVPLMVRVLQMCSHETYMDCPYYEQLMYVGDTRLEALTTYTLTADDRLPRKALRMFDISRRLSGLTQSRYPSRVVQIIPPFSLWWIGMAHDFALWRDDPAFVRSLLPGVRGVLDNFLTYLTPGGLLSAPQGWNFVDWVPGWESGIAPDGHSGVSGPINWQLVLALTQAAELEAWAGEPELAARANRLASELAKNVASAFWDSGRKLFADDLAKTRFSEHSQCLALIGGQISGEHRSGIAEGLFTADDLARTTVYFTHYLFEAYYRLGRPDAFLERMGLWFDLKSRGLKTVIEAPEPTRSDCHAWGAHPLHHYFVSVLGIRPTALGFASVQIAPQLGAMGWAKGRMPHPKGEIVVDLLQIDGHVTGTVTLPEGVIGVFAVNGVETPLNAGEQRV